MHVTYPKFFTDNMEDQDASTSFRLHPEDVISKKNNGLLQLHLLDNKLFSQFVVSEQPLVAIIL